MTEVQFITDMNGHRTGVIIPIAEYEGFLANIEEVDDEEMRAAMIEVKDSPLVPRDRVFEVLRRRT